MNLRAKSSAHEMTATSDIEDFLREIGLDPCEYAYAFRESTVALFLP